MTVFSQSVDPVTFARDLRPEVHFENTPGVHYQVEVSNDLLDWTPTDEVYGLGHEYVVTMREFTPAALPEPGPAPIQISDKGDTEWATPRQSSTQRTSRSRSEERKSPQWISPQNCNWGPISNPLAHR